MIENSMEQLFLKYNLALEKLKTKFNSLYLEFSTIRENNPIEHLEYRIKKINSIEEKLNKMDCDLTAENIDKYLNDVVGVRIVCSFLSDVKELIHFIKNDEEIKILNEKDYITHPKKNGYSSYHMIIQIPIYMSQKIVYVKAEIQVRTIAMDMWASLDHKIRYKKGILLSEKTEQDIIDTSNIRKKIDSILDTELKVQKNKVKDIINTTSKNPLTKSKDFFITMLQYEEALKIVENKIKFLREEYNRKDLYNPIEHIKSRIKTPERIIEKLEKLNQEPTIEGIETYINDVAGIRIVCSFLSDLEEMINLIKKDPDLEIIKEKDYVNFPKKSGYSSYHILVQVPIYSQTGIKYVKVEIQIRTIAMDMWASLEHKLCYQKEVELSVRERLKGLASVIMVIDKNMNNIIEESRRLVKNKDSVKGKVKIRKPQQN